MVKKPVTREPDDEPDAEPAVEETELEQDAEPEQEAAPPVVTGAASQTQVNTHTQAVTTAKGSLQSSIAIAVAAKNAGGSNAALVTAVKNANIAYYQSIIASAAAQNMPVGGAIDALKQLGAY